MSLSPLRGFLCCCNITGGYHPRLWSVVSSRLLASLHELLFVRKSDRKGPIRKRERFSSDSNIKKDMIIRKNSPYGKKYVYLSP